MNYRTLGKTGIEVSALGFGCMRLPMDGDKVDDSKAIPMLRKAVEMGVTYFDSAVGYCSRDSQRAVGDALHDLRDKVVLSTKNPVKKMEDADEWWGNLEESLTKLRTDYIDIYNVHGLSWAAFESGFAPKGGLLECLLKAREQGMIRHLCFSTHDAPEGIIKLADLDIFESVTLQYNLLNRVNEPAIRHLKKKGIGVVVMGPVGGGRLGYQTVEGEAGGATSAQLAFKFVLSDPDVDIALSGMSDMSMLEENVPVASQDLTLSSDESAEVERATEAQAALLDYYCTACGYCMPCPSGVAIPDNFTLAQVDQAYGLTEVAKKNYAALKGKARYCLECGACLEECPQNLQISDHMKRVVERLDPDAGKVAIEARVAEVSQCDEGLRIDAVLTPLNLTGEPVKGEIALSVNGRESLREAVSLKAGKHKIVKASATVTAEATPGAVTYRASLEGIDGSPQAEGKCNALFATKVETGADIAADQASIRGTGRVVFGDKELADSHGLDFRVAQDDKALIVVADVDDDLIGAADGAVCDSLNLFLDCRAADALRKDGYGGGCAVLNLAPGLGSGQATIEMTKGGGIDIDGATVNASSREGGYRIEARIPIAGLNLADGQKLIGLDIAQVSAGADGKQDVALFWSGGRQNNRGAAGFGLVRLV